MSETEPNDARPDATDWPQAVARYLLEHPDFFEHRPELLAALSVPHPESGRAISLVERQLRVLRQRNEEYRNRLIDLVRNARGNERTATLLHRFAIAMLDARRFEDALSTAQDMLRLEFGIDHCSLRLADGEPLAPPLASLFQRFSAGRPLCGACLTAEELAFLFGPDGREVASTALIALGGRTERPVNGVQGVLALGSRDPQRFDPTMGISFLSMLGDLLAHALARLHPPDGNGP